MEAGIGNEAIFLCQKMQELDLFGTVNGAVCTLDSINHVTDEENVKEIFEWLISDYGKYDKENYMPDIILKDQENKMPNYPTDLKDADMSGIDSTDTKEKLTEKWGEVNG